MEKHFIALKPFNNKIFYNNAIFDEDSKTGSSYLIAARKRLFKQNILINTMDILPNISTQRDVYMDVPFPWDINLWIKIIRNRKKNVLFIVEPPIVNPFNYMRIFHLFFKKIYTWKDDLVDNIKYFKYCLPVTKKGLKTKRVPFNNKKLLIVMNINWLPFLPFKMLSLKTKELYTERIKAIDFFDTYYSTDFYLYGRGWNKPQKFSIWQRLFGCKKYKTYKGEFHSKDKYKILSQFKFCLVFENCLAKGNISEKIIDCFKARCVPIYLGAPNIKDYISNKCFIDYRRFNDYKELIQFLKKIDKNTYNDYLTNIEKFLANKDLFERYLSNAFVNVFLEAIT